MGITTCDVCDIVLYDYSIQPPIIKNFYTLDFMTQRIAGMFEMAATYKLCTECGSRAIVK